MSFNPETIDNTASLCQPGDISQCKQWLKQKNRELDGKFDPQHSVTGLLREKSDFIDTLLSISWNHYLGDQARQLCLVAVGGYGRRELFPHSDVDILILLNHEEDVQHQQALANFSTFLWDIGLKPGLSVRTIEQCLQAARDDQTIMTCLMEARRITGNPALFKTLNAHCINDDIWSSEAFFQSKLAEQHKRYLKFHETAYNLEPNIKEGPGGLRDMQIIAWVFKHHYRSSTLKELIKYDFLPESEYQELISARDTLWRIRYALHVLTGRDENRLLFDYQREIATRFGFTDTQSGQGVEQFMQFYFKTVIGLESLNEMLLQLFSERFIYQQKTHNAYPINFNFNAVNGYIEAASPDVFQKSPLAILEIFLLQQQISSIKGVRAATIRLIRKNLPVIDGKFRQNPDAHCLFIDIFRQPHGLTTVLRRMNRYGVLAAYLPCFAHIVARMQYDLFHIYTVDEHTLFVVRNLRRFSLQKHYRELPFCNDIFRLINKPDVLYLAGLFHDIGKGKGGDHSVLGERIALEFCKQHHLSSRDTHLIRWLVRNHLYMSMTAQRKDIRDPAIIHAFARHVGSIKRLNYLYLLTVADICATNPSLWNDWKNTLLKELYVATHQALRRGLQRPIEKTEKLAENKQEAHQELVRLGLSESAIARTWRKLNDAYFLRYSMDEIIWHTIAIASSNQNDLPLVLLRPQTQSGSAEVFVYTQNQDYLFSLCTATLDQLGLTILDAKIMTSADDYALNSFQILEQSGTRIKDLYREIHICNSLRKNLLQKRVKTQRNLHYTSRQAKHFPVATHIDFQNDTHNQQTVMALITTDRPGLLSQIGKAFRKCDITLHNAKITTIGSRVEDMFYITDRLTNKPIEPAHQKKLQDKILHILQKHDPRLQ